MINRYGLTDPRIDEVRALVALQVDVLGACEPNHAAYVKRAAEAVRDDTAHVLRLAIGDVPLLSGAGHT